MSEPVTLVHQGAEARIYSRQFEGREILIKERFTKTYRHPLLDHRLTKERLRSELRGIQRARNIGIRTPTVYSVDSLTNSIYMEKIEYVDTVNIAIGKILAEQYANKLTEDIAHLRLKNLANAVGSTIGKLHKDHVIHGDLTTSNILVSDSLTYSTNSEVPSLILIDFGLSHVESGAEDKGVDLYVLERALSSTHSNVPWLFDLVLSSYKEAYGAGGEEVLKKLDEIRLRGRKRTMVG